MTPEQTFKVYLNKLITSPGAFKVDDFAATLRSLLTSNYDGTSTSPNHINDIQIASFLTALAISKYHLSAPHLAAAAKVALDLSTPVKALQDHPNVSDQAVDIVGTGGDGKNTLNCSTASAIILAACGCLVFKHGNRASTGRTGSADVLAHLGVNLQSPLSGPFTNNDDGSHPLHFLYAPLYHPSLGKVKAARRQLGFPTLFNVLGPLINPVRVRKGVIGVFAEELGRVVVETLRELGYHRAAVVWGMEGLDEVSLEGNTKIWHLHSDRSISEETINPSTFSLPSSPLSSVSSPETTEGAGKLLVSIVEGRATDAQLNFVFMNTALGLLVDGKVETLNEGVNVARNAVMDGRAGRVLQQLRGIDKR